MRPGALHVTPALSGDPEGSLSPLSSPGHSEGKGEGSAPPRSTQPAGCGLEAGPGRAGGGQLGRTESKTPQPQPVPSANSKARDRGKAARRISLPTPNDSFLGDQRAPFVDEGAEAQG